jgi:hypothetical protein
MISALRGSVSGVLSAQTRIGSGQADISVRIHCSPVECPGMGCLYVASQRMPDDDGSIPHTRIYSCIWYSRAVFQATRCKNAASASDTESEGR